MTPVLRTIAGGDHCPENNRTCSLGPGAYNRVSLVEGSRARQELESTSRETLATSLKKASTFTTDLHPEYRPVNCPRAIPGASGRRPPIDSGIVRGPPCARF